MKKTVLALSFALCASFAFAQTKNVGSINKMDRNQAMASVSMDQLQEADFNASIFTKEDPEPFQTWDFSTDDQVTTGIVSTPGSDSTSFVLPDGTTIRQSNHGNTNDYTKWRRLTSYSDPILDNQALYPGWSQRNTLWRQNNPEGKTMLEVRFDTARTKSTGHNGMMFMSMSESGPAENAHLNAYFELGGSVSTIGKAVIDMEFFQYYVNYYDECYIDYNYDGTWRTLPINVDGVDVEVNASLWGWTTITLPLEIVDKENVQLRIRYYSFKRGSAYGYWWALDDVSLIEGDADRWTRWQAQYAEGAYQMMPQGLDLPLLWYTKVRNNGTHEKTNIVTNVYQYDLNTQESTTIITANQRNVQPNASLVVPMVMDPAGWETEANGSFEDPARFGWYDDSRHVAGVTGKGVSTENVGDNYVYSTINSNSEAGEQSFDTICYQVTQEENGDRIWGYDNGILSRYQFFGYGFTDDGFLTDTGHFANANYRVVNRYTTGATIPENWVVRGLEMVVTTEPGKAEPRATIIPLLIKDEYEDEGLRFNPLNTGAGEYTVKAEDFTNNNAALDGTGYLTPGEYTTIRIMFPEQPELEPYTSYRIGYQMAEAAQFAVAAQTNRYYVKKTDANGQTYDSVVYYREDDALKKYSSFFGTNNGIGVPQLYSTMIFDPESGRPDGNGWTFGQGLTGIPMIRAIVGPKQELPTYNVTVSCEGNEDAGIATGTIQYNDQEDVCNSDVAVAEGSYAQFVIVPTDGFQVTAVVVDGESLDVTQDQHETDTYEAVHFFGDTDDGQHYDYWVVELKDVRAARTISAIYGEGDPVGIDPIAPSVRMKLQPNPATSQVRLSLSGVEGMVNCSLIDMSGRVVYSTTMNAENAEVIDLSNVAKGAYFVRITNNEFSKIEKLIVR